MTDIVDALSADEGTTCVVGAGGKKTTLYTLAGRLERAVVTATVRIPIFDDHVAGVVVSDDPVTFLDAVEDDADWPLGLVPGRDRKNRYRGYGTGTVDELAAAHDGPVLVKADGARNRDFKAPNHREPQIPESADVVVPIASAHVVGEKLTDELVHRPERVAAVTGLDVGETITAEAVGRVLASDEGGLKDVPAGATAIPLVNKVDDGDDEAVARDVAEAVLAHDDGGRVSRVVLAEMRTARVVATVE